MIMHLIAWLVSSFLVIRIIVALFNLLYRQDLSCSGQIHGPLVSLLIPVRNEEANIINLLNDIQRQNYKNIEIIIYDDDSSDTTVQLVESFSQSSSLDIKLYQGGRLPKGWLGKNHACYKLGKLASGEYYLFLDADVSIEPKLISNTIHYVYKNQVDLLSIFPVQRTITFGEKVIVPLMNWILISLLPLQLIRYSKSSCFTAANGQFMLFRASCYREHDFHKLVKTSPVEDIKIMKEMKRRKLAVSTLISDGQISCRMYNSFQASIEGFSKNLIQFFGGQSWILLLFLMIITAGPFIVLNYLGWQLFIVYLILVVILKAMVSIICRQSPVTNMLLAPAHLISLWIISFRAISAKWKGELYWKGRNILSNST